MTRPEFDVPYVALGYEKSLMKQELLTAFSQVLESGHYIMGPELSKFEQDLASFCGGEYGVGVSSGTSALHLILSSLDLKEGDEVITVPNSFIASASSIALAGGKPVFSDVGPDMNLDPELLEAAITPKTRAIIPVHLTGRPAKMEKILEIAKQHNLFVIEDAAQAIGTKLDGKHVGNWGDASAFSLHPLKNLTAIGDAGAIVTKNESLNAYLRMARSHGLKTRDSCEFWAFNCRLDEMQAALLNVQFPFLEEFTEKRRQLAFRYNELLAPYVEVPNEGEGEYCVYQTYMIQADRRDELQQTLRTNGVEVLVHYPRPLHLQPVSQYLGYTEKDFPVAVKLGTRILSLPIYPSMKESQQDKVVELISSFYNA